MSSSVKKTGIYENIYFDELYTDYNSTNNMNFGTISVSTIGTNNSTIGLNYPTNTTDPYYGNTSNTIYTTDNTNTLWINPNTNINSSLDVRGDAEISGELRVGGKNIGEALERIEQRLAILKPNQELESRWEKLKELGEEYRQLEKEILEQEEICNILKK